MGLVSCLLPALGIEQKLWVLEGTHLEHTAHLSVFQIVQYSKSGT